MKHAKALVQMFEPGALEMGSGSGHRSPAKAQGHGGAPQIEQRQHHAHHGLKSSAVVRNLLGEIEIGLVKTPEDPV